MTGIGSLQSLGIAGRLQTPRLNVLANASTFRLIEEAQRRGVKLKEVKMYAFQSLMAVSEFIGPLAAVSINCGRLFPHSCILLHTTPAVVIRVQPRPLSDKKGTCVHT